MNLSGLSVFVSKYAPLLGSVISEINPIAGLIIMALAKEFNASSDPNDLISKMSDDPELSDKLQKIEETHKDALIKNQIEDRENARAREERIIQLTGKRDWVLDIISISVIYGFITLALINYFVDIPDDRIIMMLIGQLSSEFMLCLSYYFGSSNKQ